jgi:hypothetical protein
LLADLRIAAIARSNGGELPCFTAEKIYNFYSHWRMRLIVMNLKNGTFSGGGLQPVLKSDKARSISYCFGKTLAPFFHFRRVTQSRGKL